MATAVADNMVIPAVRRHNEESEAHHIENDDDFQEGDDQRGGDLGIEESWDEEQLLRIKEITPEEFQYKEKPCLSCRDQAGPLNEAIRKRDPTNTSSEVCGPGFG